MIVTQGRNGLSHSGPSLRPTAFFYFMQQKILAILFVLFLSIGTVFALHVLSGLYYNRPNHFTRLFIPHALSLSKSWDIRNSSWHIAGLSKQHAYLGNNIYMNYLLDINVVTTDTQEVHISLPGGKKIPFSTARLSVDSPGFSVADGQVPIIFRGTVSGWRAVSARRESFYFDNAVGIGPSSLAIRKVATADGFVLGKKTDSGLQTAPGLLTRQADGIFCKDGTMCYDPVSAHFFYVYYYRNQFVCTDSNLQLLYRGHTIDTVSQARINSSRVSGGRQTVMSTPGVLVNKRSCVGDGDLFVQSALIADNENKKFFDNASTIDVYGISDGKYRFSFYVSDHQHEKMRDFRVSGHMLVALYEHTLCAYDHNTAYFAFH